jgi:class 3 adenylate cyclase
MASFSRLIKFDKRGTGMSDPVSGAPTLETRMDDVRAVMDAVGCRRAALYGLSEGASMSVLFAATYPERTAALVLRSAVARTLWAPDYPWGPTRDQYEQEIARQLSVYGPREEARTTVRSLGRFDDDELEAFVDYLRYGASPGMLEALLRMNAEIDVRDVLPVVRVPTLLLHGADDERVPPEAARYLASRIPGARFIELPGIGHLALGGAAESEDGILVETKRFLTDVWESGGWEEAEPDRMLATVLFTDIVDASGAAVRLGDRRWRELLARHHSIVRRELVRFRGREIDSAGDGFFAAFDGPARAIRCACAVVERVRELGIELRAGLHTGECEIVDDKVAGIAVHIGARVAASAGKGDVLVSSTVKDLVAGSGIAFQDCGPHQLKGIPGEWRLFRVETQLAD